MKIAVLGSNGFIGSNIVRRLSQCHSVTSINRTTLDSLNFIAVKDFLTQNKFDIIVNAAAIMTDPNTIHDARNNLGLFMNFFDNSELFGKMINLGSGAEYDRDTNISNALEEQIFECMPADSYGLGQNIKSRLCYNHEQFYTIRIFNCFGQGELSTRLFPKIVAGQHIEIQDRYFDYFSIQDLLLTIEHCINNEWTWGDVNAVYVNKIKVSEAVELFCSLNNIKPNYSIVSTNNNNYTGSGIKLQSLGVKLQGLEQGFKEYL